MQHTPETRRRNRELAAHLRQMAAASRHASSASARAGYELVHPTALDTRISMNIGARMGIDRAMRAALERGDRIGHLTLDRPAWKRGDRLAVRRRVIESRDDLDQKTYEREIPLALVIRSVTKVKLGKLTNADAAQLGMPKLVDVARAWLDEHDPEWREPGEFVDSLVVLNLWGRWSNTTAYLTRWSIIEPHETRLMPIENGRYLEGHDQWAESGVAAVPHEPELVDAATQRTFTAAAQEQIHQAVEAAAQAAVAADDLVAETKRRQRQAIRQKRRIALRSERREREAVPLALATAGMRRVEIGDDQ